jgi:3-dehydroquinate synthase
MLSEAELARITALLQRLGLPVKVDFDRRAIIDALKKDKKRQQDQIHFVLLQGLGNAVVVPIAIAELERWLMAA